MFLFFIDHSPSRRIMRRIWLWSSALKQNLNYTCSVETTYVRHCLEIHSNYINIKYYYWSNEAVYYSLRLWSFIKYPLCSFWKLKQYLIVIMAYTAVNEITCLFACISFIVISLKIDFQMHFRLLYLKLARITIFTRIFACYLLIKWTFVDF